MTTKVCSDCGSAQPVGVKFCGNCGHEFQPPARHGPMEFWQRQIAGRVTHKWRYVVAACVVLGIVVLALWVHNARRQASPAAPDENTYAAAMPPQDSQDAAAQPELGDAVEAPEPPSPLPDKLPDVSPPEPPTVKPPSEAITKAVTDALAELDAKSESGGYGSVWYSCANERQVFQSLNNQLGAKAVPAIVIALCAAQDPLERYKAALLVNGYLREPSAKGMTDEMLDALAYALGGEGDRRGRSVLLKTIKEAPAPSSARFQRLYSVFRSAPTSALADIIPALSELASPGQRNGLAAEMVTLLGTTSDSSVASAAAGVVRQFGYREAWPNLLSTVSSAPSGCAHIIARVLRELTPADAKKRAQVGAVMTKLLSETNDGSLAAEAAKTIVEFQYQGACPSLRDAIPYATANTVGVIAQTLASLQDSNAASALRSRLSADRNMETGHVVDIGKALYELQGNKANGLLFECFKDGQVYVQCSWIAFFKEKSIREARTVVRQVRDTTTNDSVRTAADDYLKTFPEAG